MTLPRSMLMDPSKHPAAGCLADELNAIDNPHATRLVSHMYFRLDTAVRELAVVKDGHLRNFCITAMLDDLLKQLGAASSLTPYAKSLTENVLKTRIKMARRGDNRRHIDRKREKYDWQPDQ